MDLEAVGKCLTQPNNCRISDFPSLATIPRLLWSPNSRLAPAPPALQPEIWDHLHQISGIVGAFPAHPFPLPEFLVFLSSSPPGKHPQLFLGSDFPTRAGRERLENNTEEGSEQLGVSQQSQDVP